MFERLGRRVRSLVPGMAALLAAIAISPVPRAEEPAGVKASDETPVRKELEEFRTKMAKTAPAERLRVYEQGIVEVRKLGVVDKAKKVGDRAPDFELLSASGKTVKLSSLIAQGPVIVTWYRGGWCPYCNIALRGFHRALPEIRAAGGTLVAISPEIPENTMSTAQKNQLDFEVLSDPGNKAAHAYAVAYKIPKMITDQMKGRLDLAKHNGDESAELPLGATYVIDREGIIRYAFVDADYRTRAEPAAVIAALRELSKKP